MFIHGGITLADNNSRDDLFGNLSGLGLDGFGSVSIYSSQEEKVEKQQKKETQANPRDFVYDRKTVCPVCSKNIAVKAVKTSGMRIISRDTDFMTYYQEPNPMFYDAWVCTQCGYAALSNKFGSISDKQVKLIKDNISAKWKFNKIYPDLYDADTAIEMHQLALLNTVIKAGRDSEKAMTCLKLAWLYRLKKDAENENKFIFQALQGFTKAFEKEPLPIAGMDGSSLQYLIGELYRRLGDNSNALLWFSRVISDRNTKPKIKDMARDQKDIILARKNQ